MGESLDWAGLPESQPFGTLNSIYYLLLKLSCAIGRTLYAKLLFMLLMSSSIFILTKMDNNFRLFVGWFKRKIWVTVFFLGGVYKVITMFASMIETTGI